MATFTAKFVQQGTRVGYNGTASDGTPIDLYVLDGKLYGLNRLTGRAQFQGDYFYFCSIYRKLRAQGKLPVSCKLHAIDADDVIAKYGAA